jgi:hypothetical protein
MLAGRSFTPAGRASVSQGSLVRSAGRRVGWNTMSGTATGLCERLVREVRGHRCLTLIRVYAHLL